MTATFDPNMHINSVVIVGCGGTGAAAARIVARIIYDLQRSRRHTPNLMLVDHDIVEAKNIGRQAFAMTEIGRFKAEAIARRLNFSLGLDVSWISEPLDASRHHNRYSSQIVISCVDNHAARQEIHRLDGVLIASGNHKDSGQVCIGNTDDVKQVRRCFDEKQYHYLPKEGLLFPDLLQPEPVIVQPAVSCGELVESGEQSLLVNDWQANVIGNYVYKLLHRQPITSFLTFIDSDSGMVTSKAICREELEVYV